MKVLSSLVLILYLFLSVSFAAEIQSDFHIVDADQVVKEGDIVEGVLKLWPVENADFDELKKLQDKVLFNTFYLTEIQSLKTSENNADVVEMKAWFIVKANDKLADQPLNYKGRTIFIPAPKVKIEKASESDDYYVMNQSTSYAVASKIIFIIAFIVLLLFAIIKRENIKTWLKKFKNDPKSIAERKFKELFQKASSREEFERIYALRKEWLELIEEKAPAYQEFFKVMNQHQYKKSWGSEELSDVQSCFDIIRGSFK